LEQTQASWAITGPFGEGGGGRGIPSATTTDPLPFGGGGNGMPSANCIRSEPCTDKPWLTGWLAGTTMNPKSRVKLAATTALVKRMDDTSRRHPLRSLTKPDLQMSKRSECGTPGHGRSNSQK
jgi:hypothetical protein